MHLWQWYLLLRLSLRVTIFFFWPVTGSSLQNKLAKRAGTIALKDCAFTETYLLKERVEEDKFREWMANAEVWKAAIAGYLYLKAGKMLAHNWVRDLHVAILCLCSSLLLFFMRFLVIVNRSAHMIILSFQSGRVVVEHFQNIKIYIFINLRWRALCFSLLALAASEWRCGHGCYIDLAKKKDIISCAGQGSVLFIFPIVSFAKVHRLRNESPQSQCLCWYFGCEKQRKKK